MLSGHTKSVGWASVSESLGSCSFLQLKRVLHVSSPNCAGPSLLESGCKPQAMSLSLGFKAWPVLVKAPQKLIMYRVFWDSSSGPLGYTEGVSTIAHMG